MPSAWKEGLPAGKYTLRLEGGSAPAASFTVESQARRDQVAAWLTPWKAQAGEDKALETLLEVEYLLAQLPHPYLTDALDLLDELPAQASSPYWEWRRRNLVARLHGEADPPPLAANDATGVAAIDEARRFIEQGRWTDAFRRLDTLPTDADPRSRALADLYRGVVQAESGLTQEEQAEHSFLRAIDGLRGVARRDQFRAHNNYANFCLSRAEDRIFNHAFAMAAGVRSIFFQSLLSWETARDQYERAEELATQLSAAEQAVVQANVARLYLVLADLVATLDAPDAAERKLAAAEQALRSRAAAHARRARDCATGDAIVSAVAVTVLAHAALRGSDLVAADAHARDAQRLFVRAGSLCGVEATERLLATVALAESERAQGPQRNAARQAALTHFRRSHQLAEFLRGQVPLEQIGLTRAGFFARRIYVYERLVELLISEGRPAEALYFAEMAKARALQDLLTLRGMSKDAGAVSAEPRTAAEILADWPRETLALEYFLTAREAWLFAVFPDGNVSARVLVKKSGRPLLARELVARVQRLLRTDFDDYSSKLRQRILDGRGFDHAWQDELHELYCELLPEDVRGRLREVRTLLIVPHHLLHYFPFPALVTQTDSTNRMELEMVQPRFLLDEACHISYAPSLAVWDLLRRRPDVPVTQAAALGVADLPGLPALPGVTAEMRALQGAFPGRVQPVVRGSAAHKETLLGLLRQPGMLLVGVHGQNWPDRPLESALYLYPSSGDNGRLTATELYSSDVHRDLTVLSACYTALADKSPLPGDDLFGLQRALLQSGGRTVIAGQWDIYDQTGPELMSSFFQNFGQGQPVAEALASAQRAFLAKLRSSSDAEPWLHPYFWAVYTVAGDSRTRFQTKE